MLTVTGAKNYRDIGSNFHQFKDYGFKINKKEKKSRYLQMKAIWGDASDNIKGVPNVGEATALKIMTNFEDYQMAIFQYSSMKNDKRDWRLKAFLKSEKIVKRNMKLMDLKYYCRKHFKDSDLELFEPRFKMKTFLNIISKPEFSFLLIVEEFKYWSMPFKKLRVKNK